jgi:hypothetical protein
MPLRTRLRADLAEARKAGHSELVALIRTLIAAIDNAEAVDVSTVREAASEAPRRHLSEEEVLRIVLDEGDDLRSAADDYDQRGRPDEAQRLRSLAKVADRYAAEWSKFLA